MNREFQSDYFCGKQRISPSSCHFSHESPIHEIHSNDIDEKREIRLSRILLRILFLIISKEIIEQNFYKIVEVTRGHLTRLVTNNDTQNSLVVFMTARTKHSCGGVVRGTERRVLTCGCTIKDTSGLMVCGQRGSSLRTHS